MYLPRLSALLLPLLAISALARDSSPSDQIEIPLTANSAVINIVSATDTDAISPVIEAFEKLYPSIKVNYTEYESTDLYSAVNSGTLVEADVVMSSAMDLQTKLVNDGLAVQLNIPESEDLPAWSNWRGEVFGFTFEPVAFAINKAAFQGKEPPSDHEEFANALRTDPEEYFRKIGTYDIRLSGTGYLFASQDRVVSGISGRVLEGMARSEAKLYCCTSVMLDELSRGEIIIAYNVLGSYALARARVDSRIDVIWPNDYTLVMSRVAFVPKTSKRQNEARAFIQFLLSREGQRIIAERSSLIALRSDVSGESTVGAISENQQLRFSPIKVAPSILVFQDKMKRDKLIREWTDLFSKSDEFGSE